ncbi:hypothetical protein CEXT_293161 [Caerostris extrusa]|uniref:Uncharacterized protein n=1 Tax=Caerostris extrusa TaxID=172846 RepID=A0AAV4T3I3_CAEEX|nr:hypothetical protein CEXT_293161 [Caerostris extrusa]
MLLTCIEFKCISSASKLVETGMGSKYPLKLAYGCNTTAPLVFPSKPWYNTPFVYADLCKSRGEKCQKNAFKLSHNSSRNPQPPPRPQPST